MNNKDKEADLGQTPLIQAAADRNGEKTALSLLHAGADIHSIDQKGQSALHHACYSGHQSLVNALLAQGADPHKVDSNGNSVLHLACRRRHARLVAQLLQLGLDVNQQNAKGETPLMLASLTCEKTALRMLKSGVHPHKVDVDGDSVLHYACLRKRAKLVARLLQLDLDVNQQNAEGETSLMFASATCNKTTLLLLKKGANPNILDLEGQSALHHAIKLYPPSLRQLRRVQPFNALSSVITRSHICLQRYRAKKVLSALIAKGADIDQRDTTGHTLLMAASYGYEKLALFLLKKGAKPHLVDNEGNSLLHMAGHDYNPKLVTRLLKHGADIDRLNSKGETPLLVATNNLENQGAAMLLLKNGAEPRKLDHEGNSALHHVCQLPFQEKYMLEIVEELLERGVDIDQQNARGETPLMAAEPLSGLFLLEKGADLHKVDVDGNSALHHALRRMTLPPNLSPALIKSGANLEQQNAKGETPLMAAMKFEYYALLLLETAVDVHKVDHQGNNALHFYAYEPVFSNDEPRDEVIEALLQRGLDINQPNAKGETPLIVAARSQKGEKRALCLLEAGADPSKIDAEGQTALHYAQENNHQLLIRRLRSQ